MSMENEIKLVQTCVACPEQYDAFIGEKKVGYLRLRHGVFTVDFPDCGGERIYESYPDGDGMFFDGEREGALREAKNAILAKLEQSPNQFQ